MLKEPHASMLVASIVDYCQASRGYEAQRLFASMRRLMSNLTPAEVEEIGQRVRGQIGIREDFPAAVKQTART